MLSQDNSPSRTRRPKSLARTLLGGICVLTLASFGLIATTTHLQWHLPSFDTEGIEDILNATAKPKTTQTIAAHAIKKATPPKDTKTTSLKKPTTSVPGNINQQSVKLAASASVPSVPPQKRAIKQPGNNIIITQLSDSHQVPLSNGGMPKFYEAVLEPKEEKTKFGLMRHTARKDFGYDNQDIFTGEVPDGAYVIHCHQPKATIIRAMCWRELQVSDDQWVQYRFPRSQLKDWWKIEKKVRANIG